MERDRRRLDSVGLSIEADIAALEKALEEAKAQLERLRSHNLEVHTMVACTECGRGVRPRNAVLGMCPVCAEERLVKCLHDMGRDHT